MSVKVTMNLTERDVSNTEGLQSLTGSRTKAQAVSTALSVTKLLAQKMSEGGEVLIRAKDGSIEKLVIPEMV